MSVAIGGLLKHIPCPNGDACATYRCLFRHAKDEIGLAPSSSPGHPQPRISTVAPRPLASQPLTPTVRTEASPQHHHAGPQGRVTPNDSGPNPRKRGHVDDSGSERGDDAVTQSRGERALGLGDQNSAHIKASAPAHPSKRPRPDLGQQADNDTSKPETPPAAAMAAPTKPGAKPNKLDLRHIEVLNPRHVKSSPAKHEIRLRLLKMLHKHFKRLNDELRTSGTAEEKASLVLSEPALITLALDLEESFAVSKSSAVYSDSMKHRVAAYMRMKLDQWIKERTEYNENQEGAAKKRDSAVALSESATFDEWSPTVAPTVPNYLSRAEEIEELKRNYLTPIDNLAAHGYVPTVPSDEEIQAARDAEIASAGWEVCSECSTRFQVFPERREEDGALTSRGPCVHHPSRYDGYRDAYYCCGMPFDYDGCVTNASHHFKVSDVKRLAALWNFVETPPNPNAPADRAVCFDCEMGYTVYGMEVIRLTATDWRSGSVLLDVLVRPLGAIIDLNSKYSGVWPKDMAEAKPYSAPAADSSADTSATEDGADKEDKTGEGSTDAKAEDTTVSGNGDANKDSDGSTDAKEEEPPLQIVSSPQAARELLFSLISPETPLIGHGLENDLNVMRIVHPTLVDTVLLFKHRKGLPYRNSLKGLAEDYLGRHIQQKTKGHDSAEDARAAGDLVRYKIQRKWMH